MPPAIFWSFRRPFKQSSWYPMGTILTDTLRGVFTILSNCFLKGTRERRYQKTNTLLFCKNVPRANRWKPHQQRSATEKLKWWLWPPTDFKLDDFMTLKSIFEGKITIEWIKRRFMMRHCYCFVTHSTFISAQPMPLLVKYNDLKIITLFELGDKVEIWYFH